MRLIVSRQRPWTAAACLLLATCTTPVETPPPPKLIEVDPITLAFAGVAGTSIAPKSLALLVSGGSLDWTVADDASWLTVSPASGTGNATVIATATGEGMTAGTYNATITIASATASNSPRTVNVALALEQPPTIALAPSNLAYTAVQGGANPANQTLSLTNAGGSTLSWTASSSVSWLTVTSTLGTGAATLTVSANVAGLSAGTHTGSITISATGATNSPQSVPVTLTVGPPPSIGVSVTALTFTGIVGGANPANQNIDVTNSGGGTLAFTVTDDASWLTVSPGSGTAPTTLAVSVSSGALAAGTHTATITIAASGAANSPRTVAVTLTIAADYSGTWTGKTSQDSTITLTIVNNAVSQIYMGFRVPSCSTTGTTTTTFTTPFSVASGSFNRTSSGSPLGYTITGTFTSPTAVNGNLTLNFSMTVPFSCSSTVNLTWSASKQ